VALWTKDRRAVALTYLWSPLTLQAVLTPSLGEDFPDLRYLAYWTLHLLILWSAAFLVAGQRLRPSWHGFRVTVVVTLSWAAAAATFNLAFGTNYGYLSAKPAGGSALDLLGPWPGYLLAEAAVVVTAWALMTAALAGWGDEHSERGGDRGQRAGGGGDLPGARGARRVGAGGGTA
jgi:hypothetical integral membrane protein (TIGR02206 family)